MPASENKKKRPGLFGKINFGFVMPNLLFIVFVTALLMFYIANGHYANNMIRKINAMQRSVKELKTEYVMMKTKFVSITRESELLRQLKPLGFEPLNQVPVLLRDSLDRK